MSIEFLLFVLIGRLLIFLGMSFPPFSESKWEFFKKLWNCDLCAGVWVFTFLSFAMKITILSNYFYIPLVAEIVTGCVTAFLVHLAVLGWKTKFDIVII